ncbi:UNVERIFIED_CONTAM: hypothetical protein Sangu_2415200 [Sesamum angustifolium]|uniref:DUF4283 domain-containing protein n=1 Tax=Sesamum angustifolium TaxID=2727405 RepID=A0AAW2KW08_9LAMI
MVSKINHLGVLLSLSEEEESCLIMPTGVWHAYPVNQGLFVVGRLLSSRSFHPDALQSTLLASFNPVRGMEFKMIEGDRFLLKFFHPIDKQRVMANCPRAYDKHLIVLAPLEASENPSSVDLNWCEFYIHIHGLPIGKMSNEVASVIGNKLGCMRKMIRKRMGGMGFLYMNQGCDLKI